MDCIAYGNGICRLRASYRIRYDCRGIQDYVGRTVRMSEKKDCYHCQYLKQNWRYCYCEYQKCEIVSPGLGCLYFEVKEEKNDAERDLGM